MKTLLLFVIAIGSIGSWLCPIIVVKKDNSEYIRCMEAFHIPSIGITFNDANEACEIFKN